MIKRLLIHPEELSKKWIDRMADAKVDVLGLHPIGGEESHRHIENMLSLLKTDEYRALLDYAVSRGLKIEYEMHAASFLVPRELFEKHPEYFGLMPDGKGRDIKVICMTHPEVEEIKATMKDCGALGACMTGSGSAVYGIFDSFDMAAMASMQLMEKYKTFLSRNVD